MTGACAGGGYELALAADHIMLVDDGSSAVSLPELPLLAVLPGTGGLTRVTDKRKVRRDHADVFCTTEEGVKGKRAVDWRLVDEVVAAPKLEQIVAGAREGIRRKVRSPVWCEGCRADAAEPRRSTAKRSNTNPSLCRLNRGERIATITLRGPDVPPPAHADEMTKLGADFWPLRLARELDDAILDIRSNEGDIAVIVFKSEGDPEQVLGYDAFLEANTVELARA